MAGFYERIREKTKTTRYDVAEHIRILEEMRPI